LSKPFKCKRGIRLWFSRLLPEVVDDSVWSGPDTDPDQNGLYKLNWRHRIGFRSIFIQFLITFLCYAVVHRHTTLFSELAQSGSNNLKIYRIGSVLFGRDPIENYGSVYLCLLVCYSIPIKNIAKTITPFSVKINFSYSKKERSNVSIRRINN